MTVLIDSMKQIEMLLGLIWVPNKIIGHQHIQNPWGMASDG